MKIRLLLVATALVLGVYVAGISKAVAQDLPEGMASSGIERE